MTLFSIDLPLPLVKQIHISSKYQNTYIFKGSKLCKNLYAVDLLNNLLKPKQIFQFKMHWISHMCKY